MQRPWFSRRWVVQELALAQRAILYCGTDRISWKRFAIAVELLVEVETVTHRLSEVMKTHRRYQYVPSYFDFVSALGASLLVDANERLFRDYKETEIAEASPLLDTNLDTDEENDSSQHASDSDDSDAGTPPSPNLTKRVVKKSRNRIQPLLSLEYLVSSLSIFDTSVPHDTIYALLAIAKDTTPRAFDSQALGLSNRTHDSLDMYTQRKSYNVDYNLPYVDVCKEFIMFAIERTSPADRSRALDVICRPWAIEEKRLRNAREKKQQARLKEKREEKRKRDLAKNLANRWKNRYSDAAPGFSFATGSNLPKAASKDTRNGEEPTEDDEIDIEDMVLPSWVPQLSRAPYAMASQPGHAGPKMSRINADPLVGLPSLTQRNYSAAETKHVDMTDLRFRKRSSFGHFSMYVRGFVLDSIQDREEAARTGQIPREWAELGDWEGAKGHPPDEFWRTLVANRGKDGKNPPLYYSRACEESFKKGGFESGAVDTGKLIECERNSVVAQFCRRVQAVTWNRSLVKTTTGKLGLVGKGVEKGDQVCILYGCSVPVILRPSPRKEKDVFDKELEDELLFRKKAVVQSFKSYALRKKRHTQQKGIDKKQLCRQWFKARDWLRSNGFTRRRLTDDQIRTELMEILGAALKDLDDWRFKEREKTWPAELAKMEKNLREAAARKNVSKPGKGQFDEIVRKRKEREEKKAQDAEKQRKRAKRDSVVDSKEIRTVKHGSDAVALDNGMAREAHASTRKPIAPMDWWAFEYALVAGRRWRKIVAERKKERAAFGLRRTEVHWNLKKLDDYQNFESERRNQGNWEDPSITTNGECSSASVLSKEESVHPEKPKEQSSRKMSVAQQNTSTTIRPSWKVRVNKDTLSDEEKEYYGETIRKNLRDKLGEDGYYSYELLGESYIHGMMDGEAMLYQNIGEEGDEMAIPSMVFEIR